MYEHVLVINVFGLAHVIRLEKKSIEIGKLHLYVWISFHKLKKKMHVCTEFWGGGG